MHKAKLLRSQYTGHKYFPVKFANAFENSNKFVEHLQTAAPAKCYL